jgi:hypothetical protein
MEGNLVLFIEINNNRAKHLKGEGGRVREKERERETETYRVTEREREIYMYVLSNAWIVIRRTSKKLDKVFASKEGNLITEESQRHFLFIVYA